MSQFYVWDENNVNIQNSTDFLNDNQRRNGFASGTPASSSRTNTALRQATLITAAFMEVLTNFNDNSALTVQSSINDVKQAIYSGFANFEASHMTVDFLSNSNREALVSGETLSASVGKISGWLSALKSLAFKTTISTSDITNSAITTDKLGNSSVTANKIANRAITTLKLADKAVISSKINDGAIETSKFAFGANCICPRAKSDAAGNDIQRSYAKLSNATTNVESNTIDCSIGTVFIAHSADDSSLSPNAQVTPFLLNNVTFITASSIQDDNVSVYTGTWKTTSQISFTATEGGTLKTLHVWLVQRVA